MPGIWFVFAAVGSPLENDASLMPRDIVKSLLLGEIEKEYPSFLAKLYVFLF